MEPIQVLPIHNHHLTMCYVVILRLSQSFAALTYLMCCMTQFSYMYYSLPWSHYIYETLRVLSWTRHTWSDNKVHELATVCFIHYEFVPTGQTVNQVYYLEVPKRLREKVRRKRPELSASNSWILHHDNAPAHTALSVKEFLATKQITVLEHPAYSPDLAPTDLFSVPKGKGNIERKAFWWHWWHQE